MEKMMPIVPGCRALMLETKFFDRQAPDYPIVVPAHEVRVDRPWDNSEDAGRCQCGNTVLWFVFSPQIDGLVVNCACKLIRIDGGDFEREKEREMTGITSR